MRASFKPASKLLILTVALPSFTIVVFDIPSTLTVIFPVASSLKTT